MALDTAMKALLSCHSVFSWKIASETQNPVIILRLRPDSPLSVSQNGERAETVAFRRKPPCQIQRDKRRAEEYRQRRDNGEKMTNTETRVQKESGKVAELVLNTETIEKSLSESQNNTGDSHSVGLHTSEDSATVTVEQDARGGEPETETVTRDTGGGHSSMETDTESETETNSESETEGEQSTIETARNLVKIARSCIDKSMPDCLKQKDRNETFDKCVLDWRCREAPKLLCITPDVIASCNLKTEEKDFQLRDFDGGVLCFWHFWPAIDQDGAYKEKIDKTRIELKEVLTRVREMM